MDDVRRFVGVSRLPLVAAVVSDLKHCLFTLVLIAVNYPLLLVDKGPYRFQVQRTCRFPGKTIRQSNKLVHCDTYHRRNVNDSCYTHVRIAVTGNGPKFASGPRRNGLSRVKYGLMTSNPTIGPVSAGGARGIAQPVAAPLARSAIFLAVTVNPGTKNAAAVRALCGDLSALLRAGRLSRPGGGAVLRHGIRLGTLGPAVRSTASAELHPFREIQAAGRHAVATPGDLLFHIRAKRMDLCFETGDTDHD